MVNKTIVCVCIPILVTTFPEWLSGTEPLPHTTGAVRPSSLCCSVLRAYVQFCRFDKADATADVQWHCNHRPPLWYHYFPAQSSLDADILVYWIGKIVRACAPGGSRTLDSLRARRAPYSLGQALRWIKPLRFVSVNVLPCWFPKADQWKPDFEMLTNEKPRI